MAADAARLTKDDWDLLLRRIKQGKCTPFLGAGACGTLPLAKDIALGWAKEHGYPLRDKQDLARVAQYLGVKTDAMTPKEQIAELLKTVAQPDFSEKDDIHGVLAELELPIYLTTNYVDFMAQALQESATPRREICRWNSLVRNTWIDGQPPIFGLPPTYDSGFEPTPKEPVVFHLHGHLEIPESLVLTEDDISTSSSQSQRTRTCCRLASSPP